MSLRIVIDCKTVGLELLSSIGLASGLKSEIAIMIARKVVYESVILLDSLIKLHPFVICLCLCIAMELVGVLA